MDSLASHRANQATTSATIESFTLDEERARRIELEKQVTEQNALIHEMRMMVSHSVLHA